ncbi:MAG: hypothetical protein FWC43_01525 [Planctomycetaceae bacterium]|nr:hypothetical protein [Planctomycetaceae bacterium]
MKKIACFATCFFLFAVGLRAANVPSLELKGHSKDVYCATFSPDGKIIVTGSEDKTARIWNAESGKVLQILPGHTDTVETALFLPNGKQVLTTCWEEETDRKEIVRIWDAESEKVLHKLEGRYLVSSRDGKRIIVQTWDANDRLTYRILNLDSGKIQTIKPAGEILIGAIPVFLPDETKAVSPDGKKMVTVTQDENGNSIVQVWDTETGRALRRLGAVQRRLPFRNAGREDAGSVHGAIFSPDGKKIVTQSWDDTIQIWDADKGTALLKLEGFSADYSADGTSIVTASAAEEDVVRIWDANSGKKTAEIVGTLDLKFSPDGKKMVTESMEENVIRMWDVPSGKELYKLADSPKGFSPDGKKVVTSDTNTTRILEADSGKELQKVKGNYLAFSPDSGKIATATGKTVRIWMPKSE